MKLIQDRIAAACIGLVVSLSCGLCATAAAAGGDFAAEFNQRAVKVHNQYRAKHHAPALSLDKELARGAQAWAERLAKSNTFAHSQAESYGENLYASMGRAFEAGELAERAVTGWYNEVRLYDYKKTGFSMKTGHFTQLVWKGTTKMGCGAANSGTRYVVVCRYAPPGNEIGSFQKNVLRP